MAAIKTNPEVVIIGGVACGPKAAATLARRLPDARITVYQRDKYLSFGTCGLPYFASGDIPGIEALTETPYGVQRTPEFFKKTKGIDLIAGAEVTAIDRESKTVTVKIMATKESFEKRYDQLLIATGARPNRPPFAIPETERIGFFTKPDDALQFRKLAETGQVGKAIIIGGGFIGCELAEAAGSLWGIETTLIEKENQLLPYALDPEISAIVERELARQEVQVFTGVAVEKIELNDSGNPLVYISEGDTIEAEYVFLSLGVTPETELARTCGLKIGETGGILVDSHLRTSDPDIYAGGDCVESLNQVNGKKFHIPMGSLANRHGRIIAENIAGNEIEYKGALGTFFVKVFDINAGAVGITEQKAAKSGIKYDAVWGSFPDHAEYYPEAENISLKLVFDPDNQRILGLQAVGKGDIFRRIDVCSALMQNKANLRDMLEFEQGYAPPFSEALDPLHHMAAIALSKIDGVSFIKPGGGSTESEKNTIWVDVRELAESEAEPWPESQGGSNFIRVPLNDLREATDKFKDAKKIIIVCKRGVRSYQAANILRNAGYNNVHIIGGGYQAAIK